MKETALFYYGKKLIALLLSLLLLSAAVFFISRKAPGDPLVAYYGERAEKMTPVQQEQARERLGLNAPLPVQYIRWLENALRGDLGISYKYKQAVGQVIGERVGNTLILGGIGFALIFIGALALGVLCAFRENGPADRFLCKAGTVTSCIPEFWLSLLLILLFAVNLQWLPSSGAYSVGNRSSIPDRLLHLILPLTVTVLSHLWYYAYLIRNKLLEEVGADYVLLAKAKGLSRRRIMISHCLRNMIPTYLGLMAISVPHILGGTYIVEAVFSYPGLGTLAYESARYHDYNLLMVLSILSGALVIVSNLLAQVISQRIDPRMSRAGEEGRRYG